MSEHHFGPGNGRVTDAEFARIEAIASAHDATFIRYREPGRGGRERYWFECRNLGEPFNGATARAVLDAVGEVATVQPRAVAQKRKWSPPSASHVVRAARHRIGTGACEKCGAEGDLYVGLASTSLCSGCLADES